MMTFQQFYNTQISPCTYYSYLSNIPNRILHIVHYLQLLNSLESIKLGLEYIFFQLNCIHHSMKRKNQYSYHEFCRLDPTVGMFYRFDCSNTHLSIGCNSHFPFSHKKDQSLDCLLSKERSYYQKLHSQASNLSNLHYSYPLTYIKGFASYTSHLLRYNLDNRQYNNYFNIFCS